MTTFLSDARETVAPRRGSKDGLLPPLLVALTVVTGLVDAFSYLVLGHVFVANQTGNVVFFAFALAGATGAHVARRLISVAAMLVGALVGAVLVLHARIVYPLAIALFILAVVALAALARASTPYAPSSQVS